MYDFIAVMRETKEEILLCEWDNLGFFERIMNNFSESDHIERFIIRENNVIIKEKILGSKKEGKQLCLKRT